MYEYYEWKTKPLKTKINDDCADNNHAPFLRFYFLVVETWNSIHSRPPPQLLSLILCKYCHIDSTSGGVYSLIPISFLKAPIANTAMNTFCPTEHNMHECCIFEWLSNQWDPIMWPFYTDGTNMQQQNCSKTCTLCGHSINVLGVCTAVAPDLKGYIIGVQH